MLSCEPLLEQQKTEADKLSVFHRERGVEQTLQVAKAPELASMDENAPIPRGAESEIVKSGVQVFAALDDVLDEGTHYVAPRF